MRVLLLLSLLAVAGCLSEGPPVNPEQGEREPESAVDPPVMVPEDTRTVDRWDFVDCWYRQVSLTMAKPAMEAHVPAGYSMVSPMGDGVTAAAGIKQFTCEALVIGNATIVAPISMAITGVSAEANESPPNATSNQAYQFEWFIDNATAAEFLRHRGFEAHYARIAASEGGGELSVTIVVADRLWYEATGHYGSDAAPPQTYEETHFHGANFTFANLHYRTASGGIPYMTTVTAEDGVFSKIAAGQHAGLTFTGPADLAIEFQSS